MKQRKTAIALAAGILIGSALAAPAAYAATGVLAERSAHTVYVDGQRVNADAYLINGENYFRLRDVGQMVGFDVYWDGAVQVKRGVPYTGEASATASGQSEMILEEPNPAIFTGPYTREAYDAVSEVLAALKSGDDTHRATIHIGTQEDRWRLENMLANLGNGYTLSLRGIENGVYEVYAHEVYRIAADPFTDGPIEAWSSLNTDKEKVRAANEYLCDRLIFDGGRFASVPELVSAPEPLRGNCAAFACAMNYLCGRLDIPCIRVGGENHFWNLLWCDGEWSYTDVSLNDQVEDHAYMLCSPTARKQSADPEGIRFLQELLVPGSTK